MCFVVVQHLSPDFDSVMDELLAKQTDMPIEIIETGKVLKPNTVYLNPPRADAQVIDGRFVLDVFPEDELRMPISSMFRSIAIEYGAESVAVVLSGTGSDGTAGLQRVHEFAGLTIVQSLETAQFDGMPKNAIATERVDYILSPGAIAQLLFEHSVEPVRRPSDQQTHKNPDDSTGIQLIFSLLANTYGINFAHYKPTTVARRIDRRLKLSCHDSLDEYSQVLLTDQDELDLLYHDLLIGVTKFFRDPKAFDLLSKEFDRLIDGLPDGEQLRIWSVGCASGEEAYSIAMMLWLLFEQRSQEPRFKVFATDVHDRILETASRGIYVADEIDGLSPELREQFLVDQGEGNVRVAPFLRNRLVFAKQNVVNDPPSVDLSAG
jgi:two-component system CheB/CheR fusion protein